MVLATNAPHDKLSDIATAVMLERAGMFPAGEKMPEGAAQCRHAHFVEFLETDLKARGMRT